MLCLLLVGVFPTTSVAHDERQWQSQYCEGMKLEKHLPSGGQVDCLSPEYAIEVEWAKKWAEAVGPEPPSRPAELPQKPTQVAPNENSAIATEQKLSLPPLHEDSEAVPQQSGIFSCGQRKYCKDMSCAEACFHFVQCGEVDLDRDSDNIPCENVCHKPCTATKIGHVLGGRSK